MTNQKRTFRLIFILAAITFLLLPFVTTFNSALTEIINSVGLYKKIQDILVPIEARFVVLLLRMIGVNSFLGKSGDVAFYLLKGTTYYPVDLQWNCLGWQSLLLLGISFIVGFQGSFTKASMVECVLIGLFGTVIINILRMVFIAAGIYYINSLFGLLIHDYFAALTTIIYLIWFWWFSYKYVLVPKNELVSKPIVG